MPGNTESPRTDTLRVSKETEEVQEVILGPVADPYYYVDPQTEGFSMQNGLFVGRSHVGVESTFHSAQSPYYGNIFLGLIARNGSAGSSDQVWTGGLAFGKEYMIRRHTDIYGDSRSDFYFRFAPGLGVAGTGTIYGQDASYYMGLNATALLGGRFMLTDHMSLFVNGGFRTLWFPALDRVGFMGVPVVSIGIQFNASPGIPPVRF